MTVCLNNPSHGEYSVFCRACDIELSEFHRLKPMLEGEGFYGLRLVKGTILGMQRYLTTVAIVVEIKERGYGRRYCYQVQAEATEALRVYDNPGEHPTGNWVKLKGIFNGKGVDMLNPNWSRQ